MVIPKFTNDDIEEFIQWCELNQEALIKISDAFPIGAGEGVKRGFAFALFLIEVRNKR